MSVYNFSKSLSFGDVDPTFKERHFTGSFEPHYLEKNYLHKVQERFCELGFEYMVGNINGCFNNKTLAAIMAFQTQSLKTKRRVWDLFNEKAYMTDVPVTFKGVINGEFDKHTAEELNLWLQSNYLNSAECLLIKFEKTWAREVIAQSLIRAKEKVRSLGGIFPTNFIACFRNPANTTISVGMKKHSLHNTALAFDYDEWRGMQDPEKDYYYIEDRGDEYWNVYVKSSSQTIEPTSHDFCFYDNSARSFYTKKLTDRFINLSIIFKEENLFPIKRKTNWEKEYYLTEWWHFENVSDFAGWKDEMNRIGYSDEILSKLGYL